MVGSRKKRCGAATGPFLHLTLPFLHAPHRFCVLHCHFCTFPTISAGYITISECSGRFLHTPRHFCKMICHFGVVVFYFFMMNGCCEGLVSRFEYGVRSKKIIVMLQQVSYTLQSDAKETRLISKLYPL